MIIRVVNDAKKNWIVFGQSQIFIHLGYSYVLNRLYKNDTSLLAISPVDWGCRIYRLLLGRGVTSPSPMSILDMTQSKLMMRFQ